MKVLLAGGSGFIGRALAENFLATGHDVIVLGRTGLPNDYPQARFVAWDAKSSGSWTSELDGAGVLINLCGRSVDCRYSDENRRLIINSRVQATKILGEACAATANPPKIWLNANTATIYADRRGELPAHDEESVELGHGFSVGVAKSWEKAFWRSDIPHLRKIVLRISIVLGEEGGAFPVM
ncbi:MAG: NAD-dependent epimerase/dehydratase family protein, partial [Opitutales bacterium]